LLETAYVPVPLGLWSVRWRHEEVLEFLKDYSAWQAGLAMR
jgi:hypothetical protein